MNIPVSFARRLSALGAALVLLVALLAVTARLARGQDTAAVREGTTPLTLGDAARLAAHQSAAAQGGRLRAEQADARARQSRAALLPTIEALGADGQRTFNTATLGIDLPPGTNPVTGEPNPPIFEPEGQVLGPVRTIDFRGRASQTLFDYSAVERYRAARSSATAFQANAETAAEQAAAAAASAYLGALRTDAQLQARTADSALAADLLGIARAQLQAGVGVALDVTRAESQVAQVQSELIAARNARDRAQLDLRRTLGLSLDAPVTLAGALDQLPVEDSLPTEGTAVEQALHTRPDLRAADEQLRAAERQIAAIRAERLPAVGVFGDKGAVGKDYGNLKNTYTWGVQLSLPLFDGLRREGRVQEQEAVAREVDVRRRDLRDQAAVDVRGALLDLASARQQVGATRERLRLAEQELAQARERFSTGVAGNADVITAALALNGSRNLLIDALTLYQSARVGLARAEGAVTELP
jgi:outer membrane protein TolC